MEENLDVNMDKILFYFSAATWKSEAFDIVCNVSGGLCSDLNSISVEPWAPAGVLTKKVIVHRTDK